MPALSLHWLGCSLGSLASYSEHHSGLIWKWFSPPRYTVISMALLWENEYHCGLYVRKLYPCLYQILKWMLTNPIDDANQGWCTIPIQWQAPNTHTTAQCWPGPGGTVECTPIIIIHHLCTRHWGGESEVMYSGALFQTNNHQIDGRYPTQESWISADFIHSIGYWLQPSPVSSVHSPL